MTFKIILAASAAALAIAGAAAAQGVVAGGHVAAGAEALGPKVSGADPATRTPDAPAAAPDANAAAGPASTTAADADVSAGMPVKTSAGAMLGTVSRVDKSADGAITAVVVTSADGSQRNVTLPAGEFSISEGVVISAKP